MEMTDTELLKWIAEHMVSFRPTFVSATMEYIDNGGYTKEIWYKAAETGDIDCLLLLRGCVKGALLSESLQHKENV
jgi:hypothetical protein